MFYWNQLLTKKAKIFVINTLDTP